MRTFKLITVIALASILLVGAYHVGHSNGSKPDYETTYSIGNRYREVFGSPDTEVEQVLRDYIIYDSVDSDTLTLEQVLLMKNYYAVLQNNNN